MMKAISPSSDLNLGIYFYKLAERSQDVFWIRDRDYRTQIYISPAYETLWGRTCESLFENGDSWLDSLHAEDREQVEYDINQIRHNPIEGKSYTFEYRITHPDHDIRRIQEISFPIYNADQQLIGFAGIAKDVTKENLRIAELEQASNFFRFFAEKVHSVFWARDNSCNKQLYLSPGYEKVWGRSRASLYEHPDSWLNTLHPEDRERASNSARFETLREVGPDAQYEWRYRIYTPEGELRWIKDTSFPIEDEKNQFIGFAGIAEDITKEVLHEQQLLEAMQRAEVANKAKSDFLAMISHELRTPLNAILGMAQILKVKGLPDQLSEYVDIISDAGNSLLSLVSDILDFARLEAGKLTFATEFFDLRELFLHIIQNLQYQANEKNISLTLEFKGLSSSMVVGDPNRVRQVLVNLVGNSLKFTDKGSIRIVVHQIKKSENKSIFEVAVIDTGIGIRQDKLNALFEKFNQIDSIYHRKHRGIGLGLAITKQLVEAMGGEIHVKSEYGRGTEFRFTLALSLQTQQEMKSRSLENESAKPIFSNLKFNMNVLMVEDNIINQKIAKLMLEDFGCQVDVMDNGQSVLQQIDDLNRYDLIFMDVGLPDMSGFDIVTHLRQHSMLREKPIVAMTAHILDRDRQQAFDVGVNRIIAKPISYEEIGLVLQEYSGKC